MDFIYWVARAPIGAAGLAAPRSQTNIECNHTGNVFRELVQQHPEVHSNRVNFKFLGRGQLEIPVADAKSIEAACGYRLSQNPAHVRLNDMFRDSRQEMVRMELSFAQILPA